MAAASEANHRRVVDDPSGEASARQAKAAGRGRRAVLDAVEKESGRARRGDREGRRDESSIGGADDDARRGLV